MVAVPAAATPRRSPLSGWINVAALLLALFLAVAGARLWLVQNYTTPLPYADQWDGEGAAVLKPWAGEHLRFRDLFAPHNEHRIVLTRLLSLALFAVNGQWDGQLETAVNAGLCGGFAVLMAGALLQSFGARWRWTILAAVTVDGVLPFGWENTVSGFQSQNDFLIIFSLAAIWGLGLHRTATAAWWVGLLGAMLACVSMGSGFLASATVLGWLALRACRERALPGWREWITACLCGGIVAVGWLTRTAVPAHASLRTDSPAAFIRAFCRFLAWPFYDHPAFVLLLAAPLILLAAVYLRPIVAAGKYPGGRRHRGAELLLAVGGWCVLQVAALAYARGGSGTPPACRYMDLLAIFPLTNFLAAALLFAEFTAWGWPRTAAANGAVLWCCLLTVGLWHETEKDFQAWLPAYLDGQQRSEANIRGYLNTGDFQRYLAGKSQDEIAYPKPERLAELLDDPILRRFLPADVRAPLRLHMENEGKDAAFVPGGLPPTMAAPPWTRCWGSSPGGRGTTQGFYPAGPDPASALPYLQIQFAGDLGEPGLSFILRDAAGQRQVDWHPAHVPHERWRIDYVRRPGDGLRLEASDTVAGKWFAFTEPVELGAWSYWAGYALRHAGTLLSTSMVLALLTLVNEGCHHRGTMSLEAANPGKPSLPPS